MRRISSTTIAAAAFSLIVVGTAQAQAIRMIRVEDIATLADPADIASRIVALLPRVEGIANGARLEAASLQVAS